MTSKPILPEYFVIDILDIIEQHGNWCTDNELSDQFHDVQYPEQSDPNDRKGFDFNVVKRIRYALLCDPEGQLFHQVCHRLYHHFDICIAKDNKSAPYLKRTLEALEKYVTNFHNPIVLQRQEGMMDAVSDKNDNGRG